MPLAAADVRHCTAASALKHCLAGLDGCHKKHVPVQAQTKLLSCDLMLVTRLVDILAEGALQQPRQRPTQSGYKCSMRSYLGQVSSQRAAPDLPSGHVPPVFDASREAVTCAHRCNACAPGTGTGCP